MRILLLALGLVAACSKSEPAPSCADVVDHTLAVTKIKYDHGGMELGDRKGMVAQCEKENFSADMRRCLMAAKNLEEVGKCRPKKAPPSPGPGSS
jgi:hypothetical protein